MRLFLVLVLVIGLSLGGWYWCYMSTPQYTVDQIEKALVGHDVDRVREYVNLNTVSENIVDETLSKPVLSTMGSNLLMKWMFSAASGLFKKELVTGVEQELVDYVKTGSFKAPAETSKESESSKDAEDSHGLHLLGLLDRSLALGKLRYKGIESVDTSEDIGLIALKMLPEGSDKELLVKLQITKVEGKWRVDRVKNLQDVLVKLMEVKGSNLRKQLDSEQSSEGSSQI
ncbi:hypothetical protein GC174_18490 [bacterium]|nr:hypothetical protein [bacterium]